MQTNALVLDVTDFRGLSGVHTYPLKKLNAVAAPTGSGKSSVIDALKYALTGMEPDGDMINSGADSCAVRITFPSGNSFERIRFRNSRPTKYIVNGKTSTLAKMNSELQDELGGVRIGNAKMIAMGETLSSIDTKQFGELVLSYMPEFMTADDILQMLSRKGDPYIEARIREEMPQGEFGVEAVDVFYNTCMERKRILRGKIRDYDTVIRSREGLPAVDRSEEDIRNEIADLTERRDKQLILRQKKDEYNRAKTAVDVFCSTVSRLEGEISKITAEHHTDDERRSVELVLSAYRNTITTSYSAVNSAVNSENALQNAIRNISQPVCPLSSKLVCSTDKTKVITEMTASLIQVQKEKDFQQKQLETAKKKAAETEARLRTIDRDNADARRKDSLQRQLEELRKTEPRLPEKPEDPEDIRGIEAKIGLLKNMLATLKTNEQTDVYKKRRDDFEFRFQRYEYMAQAFSPKGEVKQAITEMYLKEFETPCNKKAEKIFGRMRIRFSAENGVTVYCDPKGLGRYIPFASLSAGEKAAVTFIIVLTLANISGFRFVLIDELSVLDKNVFGNLLATAKSSGDEYDMMIIACVEHDDMKEQLEKENIDLISLDG